MIWSCVTIAQPAGNKTDFDRGWKFRLDSTRSYQDPGFDDAAWRSLDLPHDWSIEGPFSKDNPATAGGGALPGGVGWYRKTFQVPAASRSKQVFIDFDGVYRNSEVWINGHSLGVRPNGYISFRYNLTPYLKYGPEKNVIVVKADNSRQPNSRWYSGSGIYRNVWLTQKEQVFVDRYGTFVTTPQVSSQSATVHIATGIRNSGDRDLPVTVVTTLYDAGGRPAGRATVNVTATGGAAEASQPAATVQQEMVVKQPALWSVGRPYLYRAVTQVMAGEKLQDTYETAFGIRTFRFDADRGFSLNGEPLKILGVCNHHDLGALGSAINTRALERQLELLKAMGCNGIRTSHNPPAPELLDLCDRMGFIVMDEAFDMWAKQKSKYDYHLDWDAWHRKDLEVMIRRDRNHPSVFVWSIGNEIPEQWGDAAKGDTSGRVIARELVQIVTALDTSRPVVTANNETGTGNNLIRSGALDLVGYNYHHQEWAGFHQKWPGKQLIVTESTSALETRGQYDLVPFDTLRRWPKRWDIPFSNPNGGYTVSAYDNVSTPWGSTHEESVKALLQNDHVSGMYIWTGFDYIGEPTPYSWPARSSYFGIIDLAGFPKDVYYMYQSVFSSQPVLHIYPHWNWKQGDTVDIVAYYNHADEVELLLNGRSLGLQHKIGDGLHVKWRVPYEAGTLKAVSRKNGKTVLTRQVQTAGAPVKVTVQADRNTIRADGKDLSFITATIVDRQGVPVPDAANLIQFSVSGAGDIAGVDSGDPVSHEPFKADKHTALNGRALVIVQSSGKKGIVTVKAGGTGLTASSITINVQ